MAAAQKKQPPAHSLDLNVASVKEQVPGGGPNIAQSMLDFRGMSGPFRRVEDLLSIKEISQRKLGTTRPDLKFTPPPAHKSPSP